MGWIFEVPRRPHLITMTANLFSKVRKGSLTDEIRVLILSFLNSEEFESPSLLKLPDGNKDYHSPRYRGKFPHISQEDTWNFRLLLNFVRFLDSLSLRSPSADLFFFSLFLFSVNTMSLLPPAEKSIPFKCFL